MEYKDYRRGSAIGRTKVLGLNVETVENYSENEDGTWVVRTTTVNRISENCMKIWKTRFPDFLTFIVPDFLNFIISDFLTFIVSNFLTFICPSFQSRVPSNLRAFRLLNLQTFRL